MERRTSGAVRVRRRRLSRELNAQGEPIESFIARLAMEVDWYAALPDRADSFSWKLQAAIKRAFDIVVSAIALILLAPLFLAVAIAIRLDSPGSILYAWNAVGYRGRRFIEYKFRTMVENAHVVREEFGHLNEMEGPVFKIRNDPRVTRLGRFLRKWSIDELPQFWNVLLGDMTLVGPRPLIWHEFAGATPEQRRKLSVPPGITCLWQISGRSAIKSFQDWVDLDLRYIDNWSLLYDAQIVLRTVPVVLRGSNAY